MKLLYRNVLLTAALTSAAPIAFAARPGCHAPGPGQPIQLESCQAGDSLVLHGLNFESGTAKLAADGEELLQQVADALQANPGVRVIIHGHTDNTGKPAFNRELSELRAEAVRRHLVAQGIESRRLQARGFGEADPLADNATAAGRAQNRRVELRLLGAGRAVAETSKPAAPPPPKTIYMTTFSAQPDQLTVPVGTTVTWKNYDEITHSVVLPDTRSDRLWAFGWNGQSFSRTFGEPGRYEFRCGVHNDVHGTIVVKPAVSAAAGKPAPAYPGNTLSGIPTMSSAMAEGHQSGARMPVSQPASVPVAAAPAMSGAAAVPAGDLVSIKNHAFSPARIHVAVGSEVRWHNEDGSRHRLAFDDLSSEVLRKGDSYRRQFDSPGEYAYECGIHSYMQGAVVVGES